MTPEQVTKRNAKALARRGKRTVQRKLKRQAHRREMARARKAVQRTRGYAALRVDRIPDQFVFLVRRGLFGHSAGIVLRVPDEELVGAVEDTKELASMVSKLGLLVASALFNYDLVHGPDGLARHIAEWAGIDLAALAAQAEEDEDADGSVPAVFADDDAPPAGGGDADPILAPVASPDPAGPFELPTEGEPPSLPGGELQGDGVLVELREPEPVVL